MLARPSKWTFAPSPVCETKSAAKKCRLPFPTMMVGPLFVHMHTSKSQKMPSRWAVTRFVVFLACNGFQLPSSSKVDGHHFLDKRFGIFVENCVETSLCMSDYGTPSVCPWDGRAVFGHLHVILLSVLAPAKPQEISSSSPCPSRRLCHGLGSRRGHLHAETRTLAHMSGALSMPMWTESTETGLDLLGIYISSNQGQKCLLRPRAWPASLPGAMRRQMRHFLVAQHA